MQPSIHNTNMSYIDTSSIVIDIFNIGGTGVLEDSILCLEPQKPSFALPYLDEDGGTTATCW